MIDVDVGKTVSISLSNGQVIGGIVEKWSPEIITLKMPKGGGITIITHPERDIVFIHVAEQKVESLPEIQQKWEDLVESPPTVDKTKKLAELKKQLIQSEKDIVASKLKEHTIGEVRTVQYGIPQFLKKPSSK